MNGTDLAAIRRGNPVSRCVGPSSPCAREEINDAAVPFEVRWGEGRLLEVRLVEVFHLEDVMTLTTTLRKALWAVGSPAMIFADYRVAKPIAQDVADLWSRSMRVLNPDVARSAILLHPDNDTFNLQLARVVRCAGWPSRRCFLDPQELRGWLAEALSPGEISRVDELIG